MLKPRFITNKSYNYAKIAPAKVGEKFTEEEKQFLLENFPEIEKARWSEILETFSYPELSEKFEKFPFDKTQADKKHEAKKKEREEREIEEEKRREQYFLENKALSDKINSLFSEVTIVAANKEALIRFLTGEDNNFRGCLNNNWEEPLKVMNALEGNKVNWDNIKSYFLIG